MANVFAILSAIALAASLFLATKTKQWYGTEIDARKKAQADAVTAHNKLENLTKRFHETEDSRKATDTVVESEQEKETGLKAANTKLNDEKSTKTTQTEANEQKITKMQEGLPVSNIQELVDDVKSTGAKVASIQDELASNDAKLADLMKEKARTEGEIGVMKKRNSDISNKVSFFTSTSISSIYPNFGFVTIPLGATAGVVPGSTLNVMRGGNVVGKVRVRSVESGRSSADIVPESMAQDVTLMVGDKVVPSTDTPAPASAPAAAGKPAAKH